MDLCFISINLSTRNLYFNTAGWDSFHEIIWNPTNQQLVGASVEGISDVRARCDFLFGRVRSLSHHHIIVASFCLSSISQGKGEFRRRSCKGEIATRNEETMVRRLLAVLRSSSKWLEVTDITAYFGSEMITVKAGGRSQHCRALIDLERSANSSGLGPPSNWTRSCSSPFPHLWILDLIGTPIIIISYCCAHFLFFFLFCNGTEWRRTGGPYAKDSEGMYSDLSDANKELRSMQGTNQGKARLKLRNLVLWTSSLCG